MAKWSNKYRVKAVAAFVECVLFSVEVWGARVSVMGIVIGEPSADVAVTDVGVKPYEVRHDSSVEDM